MRAKFEEIYKLVVTEDTTMGGFYLTTLFAVVEAVIGTLKLSYLSASSEMLRCSQAFVKRAKN